MALEMEVLLKEQRDANQALRGAERAYELTRDLDDLLELREVRNDARAARLAVEMRREELRTIAHRRGLRFPDEKDELAIGLRFRQVVAEVRTRKVGGGR